MGISLSLGVIFPCLDLGGDLFQFRRGIFLEIRSVILAEKIDLASMLDIIPFLVY